MNRVILTLALAALAFAASGAMDATFDDKNTVRSIRRQKGSVYALLYMLDFGATDVVDCAAS